MQNFINSYNKLINPDENLLFKNFIGKFLIDLETSLENDSMRFIESYLVFSEKFFTTKVNLLFSPQENQSSNVKDFIFVSVNGERNSSNFFFTADLILNDDEIFDFSALRFLVDHFYEENALIEDLKTFTNQLLSFLKLENVKNELFWQKFFLHYSTFLFLAVRIFTVWVSRMNFVSLLQVEAESELSWQIKKSTFVSLFILDSYLIFLLAELEFIATSFNNFQTSFVFNLEMEKKYNEFSESVKMTENFAKKIEDNQKTEEFLFSNLKSFEKDFNECFKNTENTSIQELLFLQYKKYRPIILEELEKNIKTLNVKTIDQSFKLKNYFLNNQ